jgi:hypothetical protein
MGLMVKIYPKGIITHSLAECVLKYCVIHNPSDHHMKEWDINIRLDRYGALAERLCPHGIGHPDPDSLAYISTLVPEEAREDTLYYEGIHGCDGCCWEDFGYV